MKNLALALMLLITLVLPGTSDAGEISDASLNKMLVLSGVKDLISHFPDMLHGQLERARQMGKSPLGNSSISDGDYRFLEKNITAAFKQENIIRAVDVEMRKSLSEENAEKILEWYDSKLGRRLVKCERDSNAPNAERSMSTSVRPLLKDKQRMIFAVKLDSELHMTEMATQFLLNTRIAMAVALQARKYGHLQTGLKKLKKSISDDMQKQLYRTRRSVIISTVYTYKSIDIKDLERYRVFLNTPAALRFNKALMKGMNEGMDQAIKGLIHKVKMKA